MGNGTFVTFGCSSLSFLFPLCFVWGTICTALHDIISVLTLSISWILLSVGKGVLFLVAETGSRKTCLESGIAWSSSVSASQPASQTRLTGRIIEGATRKRVQLYIAEEASGYRDHITLAISHPKRTSPTRFELKRSVLPSPTKSHPSTPAR